MHFFERRKEYKEETKPEGYFYRDAFGFEKSVVIGEGVDCTNKHETLNHYIIISSNRHRERELTYKNRQEEIEMMLQLASNGPIFAGRKVNNLLGKSVEEYTQKELHYLLKQLTEDE